MLENVKVGFNISRSYLKRGNKKTTLFTVIVLSLVFVNLIFMPSMINGMLDVFVGAVTDYSYGDIVIEPQEQKIYINDADSILSKINNLNGVYAATKRLASGATLNYKQKYVGSNIIGINPDEETRVSKFSEIVKEGEFLTPLSTDEIMLGRLIAGKEGGPEIYDDLGGVEVGTIINVTYSNGVTKQYKVKGIHEAGPEVSDLIALVNYKELESVLGLEGQDKASTIVIKVQNDGDEPEIKQKLLETGIKENVYTWQEKIQDMIRDILKSFNLLNYLSRIVSLIIAAFIIFMILYINTINKKKQIGILKAIGITKGSIILSYIFISLFYVLMGIILGIILLQSIIIYLNIYPIQFYETITLSPKIDISAIIENAVCLMAIALVAGFIPAYMVTKQNILKTIWGN